MYNFNGLPHRMCDVPAQINGIPTTLMVIWSSKTFGGFDKTACSVGIESSCAASVGCIDACVSTLYMYIHRSRSLAVQKTIEYRSIVYELWIFCPLLSPWHTVSCHIPSIRSIVHVYTHFAGNLKT